MNRSFDFYLVDAFTRKPLSGNPCAVLMNADSLTEDEMQSIAREMNQSETAFLMRSEKADLRARFFTPEREIPLAGHPTIASIHAALETGVLKMSGARAEFQLELRDGPIAVAVEENPDGRLVRMFQRKPAFHEIHDPDVVLPLFGLRTDDLLPGACIQTVSTGTKQLMVPVKSQAVLKRLETNVAAYREYRAHKDFFSPHIFCLAGISPDAATFARHLGTAPDTVEDSFTGSATGNMAAFLWKYNLLKDPRFVAEQGHWLGRPGRAYVEVIGPRDAIETVVVAGPAVTVVRGKFTL